MSKPLLVDTDVMIDFLRGQAQAVAFVNDHSEHIILSTIVVAELYAGARDEKEEDQLAELTSLFRAVPVTAEIAKAGGRMKRDYAKSHGVNLADALLAASAQDQNAELKTLNTRHYPMLKGLKPPYVK